MSIFLRPFCIQKQESCSEEKSWSKFSIALGLSVVAAVVCYVAYRSLQTSDLLKNKGADFPKFVEKFPAEEFVDRFERAQQCPDIDAFIKDQADKGYWGWSIKNMKRLFGSERDLSLLESRKNFYHEEIQARIPQIAKSHPDYCNRLTRQIAKDICQLRNDARDYTRSRSWWVVEKYLSIIEVREKDFKYYWNKYGKDPQKLIEAATRSNTVYDNCKYLKHWDKTLQFFDRLKSSHSYFFIVLSSKLRNR